MSNIISGNELLKLFNETDVIVNGNINNCGPLKYDFVLSDDFLKADFGSPTKISDVESNRKKDVCVMPGEVVYVLSKESLNIPTNMFMMLSANRGMSEYGILTLGGFAVDPGYNGRLMFGLYNYSSTPFKLISGRKLVGGVFHKLDNGEELDVDKRRSPKSINEFPSHLVQIISDYSPTGIKTIEDAIEKLKSELNHLNDKVKNNRTDLDELSNLTVKARKDLNESNDIVKDISINVNKISNSLKDEIEARKAADEDLSRNIESSQNEFKNKYNFIRGALWLATAFGLTFASAFIAYLKGWLNIP